MRAHLTIIVIAIAIVLPLSGEAHHAQENELSIKRYHRDFGQSPSVEKQRSEEERLEKAKDRSEQLITNILERIENAKTRIENNPIMDETLKTKILSEIVEDEEYFQSQQSAVSAAGGVEEIRTLMDDVKTHTAERRKEIQQHQSEIHAHLQTQVAKVQEVGNSINARIDDITKKLEAQERDVSELQPLIEDHKQRMESLAEIDAPSNPEALREIISTLKERLATLIEKMKSLASGS